MALSRSAMGLSVVCDCGISCSYSLTIFYVLLSPYLCFISFLYLELYVFGDDALIS